MGVLTTNHRYFWPGTEASIPDGSRDTDFDSRIARGAPDSTDPGDNGGSATHQHESDTHRHDDTLSNHTHDVAEPTGMTHGTTTTTKTGGVSSDSVAADTHSHGSTTSSNQQGVSISDETDTTATQDNQPECREMLFVQPSSGADLPDGAVCMFWDSTLPTDFIVCDGSGGTVDTDGLFICAPGTSADPSASVVGNDTTVAHNHGGTSNGHDHLITHRHTATVGNISGTVSHDGSGTGALWLIGIDHHVLTLKTDSQTSSSETIVVSNRSYTHSNVKLRAIQNDMGGASTPVGTILPWVGTLADLASNSDWHLCDGSSYNGVDTPDLRDQFIQCTTDYGEVTDTPAGTTEHDHTASGTHYHTIASHDHDDGDSWDFDGIGDRVRVVNGTPTVTALKHSFGNFHSAAESGSNWTISSAAASTDTASAGWSTESHVYLYRTVLWAIYAPSVAIPRSFATILG